MGLRYEKGSRSGSEMFMAVVYLFVTAWLTQILWNYIATSLFGLPVITYWQAFLLKLLCSLLFKNSFVLPIDVRIKE